MRRAPEVPKPLPQKSPVPNSRSSRTLSACALQADSPAVGTVRRGPRCAAASAAWSWAYARIPAQEPGAPTQTLEGEARKVQKARRLLFLDAVTGKARIPAGEQTPMYVEGVPLGTCFAS